MAAGDENLANGIAAFVLDDISSRPQISDFWASPIERLFYLAIEWACSIEHMGFCLIRNGEPENCGQIGIVPQKRILGARVDYLITVLRTDGKFARLIVECDGRDFHERTKEQAAKDRSRDRKFQQGGYTVFRFTGSEIYRDSFNCVRQVLRWAQNAAWVE